MTYPDPNQPGPYGSGPQQPYSPPPGGPYPPQPPGDSYPQPPGGSYPPPPGGSYPQPPYPPAGQQPGYGYATVPAQPAYGVPPGQPGYGPPSGRPGTVTAAAVIGFVAAALALLSGFLLLVAGAAYSSLSASEKDDIPMASSGLFYGVGLLSLILGGSLIWGGIWALQGKSGKPLFITALVLLLMSVLNLLLGQYSSVIGLIAYVVIVVLLQLQPSKQYFASPRSTTP